MVEITVLGLAPQEENGCTLLLLHPQGTERILSLNIGPDEAAALSAALHTSPALRERRAGLYPDHAAQPLPAPAFQGRAALGQAGLFPRPLTHDFLLAAIRAMGGSVSSVDILHHIDEAFIAEAAIDHPGGRCRVDCRPSDGIALALRCGAPVRASSAVLAHARNAADVLNALPEHIRSVAEAKFLLLRDRRARANEPRLPQAVEEALAGRVRLTDDETRQRILSVARKMLEEETEQEDRGRTAREGEQDRALLPRAGIQLPQIRVSLVRQRKNGDAEIVDEYHIPANGLPKEVIASLGLNGRQAAAVNAATDEERWAILLKMLAPETKVLM